MIICSRFEWKRIWTDIYLFVTVSFISLFNYQEDDLNFHRHMSCSFFFASMICGLGPNVVVRFVDISGIVVYPRLKNILIIDRLTMSN